MRRNSHPPMSRESMRRLSLSSILPIHEEGNDGGGSSSSSSSYVQMIELVTNYHTMDAGGLMDVKFLLQFMDICTCASAEKHTGVNCVTVSMGDVVFDYLPTCGDMLEFTARPVYVGRTSLDIDLMVIADCGGDESRRAVCNASFTYVTTKGCNGEKRLCPPLCSSNTDWFKTVAKYRRALIKAEQKKSASFCEFNSNTNDSTFYNSDNKNTGKEGEIAQKFDLTMTELILPAHQNHMGHTFGGIIMGWMAKAALATAARKSKRRVGSLFVCGILRIDFQCGSEVSDHLIFSSRLNAVSDDGDLAEIEVQVLKRSIDTKEETPLNVGYFYIAGIKTTDNKKDAGPIFDSPTSIILSSSSTKDEEQTKERTDDEGLLFIMMLERKQDAENRYRLFLARKRLLSGVGDVVEWHPILHDIAPILTILCVLRLATSKDSSLQWNEIVLPNYDKNSCIEKIEWIPGKALGRLANTVVIRAKGTLHPTMSNNNRVFTVASVLEDIRLNRPNWDHTCTGIEILEEKQQQHNTDHDDGIEWDVIKHKVKAPKILKTPIQKKKGMRGIFKKEKEEIEFQMYNLRAWKLQSSGDDNTDDDTSKKNEAILAYQSVHHPKLMDQKSPFDVEVLPTGWFIRDNNDDDDDAVEVALNSNSNGGAGIELTYIVEYDLAQLRATGIGVSSTKEDDHDDTILKQFAGGQIHQWFNQLAHYYDMVNSA